MADTNENEYYRGKMEERYGLQNLHEQPDTSRADLDLNGFTVWANRSGRSYIDENPEEAAQDDGPVVGNGMGSLSRLVGGKKKGQGMNTYEALKALKGGCGDCEGGRHVGGARRKSRSPSPKRSGRGVYRSPEQQKAAVAFERGARPSASRPMPSRMVGGAKTARGALVSRLMKERGVSLGEASRIIKAEGLM